MHAITHINTLKHKHIEKNTHARKIKCEFTDIQHTDKDRDRHTVTYRLVKVEDSASASTY